MDANDRVELPSDEFLITDTLLVRSNTSFIGKSRGAKITSNMTKAMIAGKNAATTRLNHVIIRNIKLDNTARTNAGSIGVDFNNVSRSSIEDMIIQNVETGINLEAPPEPSGCFYNSIRNNYISTIDVGIEIGTLANSIVVEGGQIGDCEVGTRNNDNTSNSFKDVTVESFTNAAHIDASTAATQYATYSFGRLENPNTSAPYDTAVGFKFGASATIRSQSVMVLRKQLTEVATHYTIDSNTTDFHIWDDTQFIPRGGDSLKQVVAMGASTIDFPSIAANTSNDQSISVTGVLSTDIVIISSTSSIEAGLAVTGFAATDTVWVRAANVKTSATDPASQSFNYVVLRFAAQ